ncbi:MAG: guanylate kinase [Ignavibacteria bacterium]|nr:guanylate kinase [Ignavibacteria bacterium]
MLFVISAPSGAGKTTIVRELCKIHSDLIFSISATTRKRRGTEVDGKDYFFLTKEQFDEKIKNNELVEYENVYKNDYYGTLKSFIDESLDNGKNVIFDIDVKGALSIKKLYKEKAVLIYIMPPDVETLKQRLINRATENQEDIQTRINRFDMELKQKDFFDYIVVNAELETAVREANNIILKYKNNSKEK